MTDVWQGWQFGPYLIDENGEPRSRFPAYSINATNPRTVFGYYEPGHYCFVVVDGRQGKTSRGITLQDLAKLMKDLGCVQAYNLDGGASSQLFWNGGLFNTPSGDSQRSLPDIIYITEPVGDVTPAPTLVPLQYKSPRATPGPQTESAETRPETTEE